MLCKTIWLVYLLLVSHICINAEDAVPSVRVYVFRMIAFHAKYEVYCTPEASGYFRYAEAVGDREYYFTYEGADFFRKSKFDPDYYIYTFPVPSNLYANSRGELMLFRKRFAPVTDRDKKALNFPYGYARDYK